MTESQLNTETGDQFDPALGRPRCTECGRFLAADETSDDCDHPRWSRPATDCGDAEIETCPRCGADRDGTACSDPSCPWTSAPRSPEHALEVEGRLYKTSAASGRAVHRDDECIHERNGKGEPEPVDSPAEIPLRATLCSVCFEVEGDGGRR